MVRSTLYNLCNVMANLPLLQEINYRKKKKKPFEWLFIKRNY